MKQFSVSTEIVSESADALYSSLSVIASELETIEHIISGTSQYWSGTAHEVFCDTMKYYIAAIADIREKLGISAERLHEISMNYLAAEKNNEDDSDALSAEILQ